MTRGGWWRGVSTLLIAWASLFGLAVAAEPKWQPLLAEIDPAKNGVAGEWSKSGGALTVKAAQGARLSLPVAPTGEYDVRINFTRRSGRDSVGLIVVHGGRQVTFEVDGWGTHLAGFQNIGGKSFRENATRRENMSLDNGRRYTLTVEVRKDRIRGLLDDKAIAVVQSDGSDLSLSDLWVMPDKRQLGIVAWNCDTEFHSIEVRSTSGEPIVIARNSTPAQPNAPTRPATTPAPTPPVSPANPARTTTSNAQGKRVLIVIANYHFFYREYGDPKQELERAGIQVTVAAGRKGLCRPHGGSGQGPDGGNVQADIALSDVKATDYDALLFSGGWGSSAYQFAFNGRYNEAAYNGERAVKTEANRVINEFVSQDKYVCALCNGVSVLAWARVNGKSPLAGKRVCAPVREAAAGLYNGRPAQPSCRWHPEQNGAILSPAGSIGQPGTAADDVLVDGKIITGEDDPSAREMGRRIVEVLSK
ncbi:MAG: DJ-1/PfpI family protein [Candidatus Saccharimonas sp.]|nr:DJ-1/PfpI family protein [Planctomycetaceae bacterium]